MEELEILNTKQISLTCFAALKLELLLFWKGVLWACKAAQVGYSWMTVYPDRGTHSYCVKDDTRVVIRNYALRA